MSIFRLIGKCNKTPFSNPQISYSPFLKCLDMEICCTCNTTHSSCISADLLRHWKTIIGEEDDKLVSMMAHCEFYLSSKPLFTMSHTLLNLHRGMNSRHCSKLTLRIWIKSTFCDAYFMCMHLEYNKYRVSCINTYTQIQMPMRSRTNQITHAAIRTLNWMGL